MILESERTGRSRVPEYLAAGLLLLALVIAFAAPKDAVQGDLQRLMYVHVPSAWLAFFAFGVTMIGSAAYLITKRIGWDHLAESSAEVGVLFTGLTLLQGMIWGKPTWGVWWTWDARLTLTAIMFFVYLGYLALRRSMTDPIVRARRSALLGIIAAVQVPLVHFSVVWWRGLHQPPTILRPDRDAQIDGPLLFALLASLGAFTVLYAVLVRRRMERARLEAAIDEAYRTAETDIAGDAIVSPGIDPPGSVASAVTVAAAADRKIAGASRALIAAGAAFAVAVVIAFSVFSGFDPITTSDWAWVALGYGVSYVALFGYVAYLGAVISERRRRLESFR